MVAPVHYPVLPDRLPGAPVGAVYAWVKAADGGLHLYTGHIDAEDSPLESFTTYPVRVDGDDPVIDPTPRTRTRRKPWDLDDREQCGGTT